MGASEWAWVQCKRNGGNCKNCINSSERVAVDELEPLAVPKSLVLGPTTTEYSTVHIKWLQSLVSLYVKSFHLLVCVYLTSMSNLRYSCAFVL